MRTPLAVQTLGYLVPRTSFAGRVHSVFESACNLECDLGVGRGLLTLCWRDTSVGPTTLHLASDELGDLRNRFSVGELVHCRANLLCIGRVELCLQWAEVWERPVIPAHAGIQAVPHAVDPGVRRDDGRLTWGGASLGGRIGARCRRTGALLAAHRRLRSSVIDAQAAPVVAALADACRNLDTPAALAHAQRLIGWGEGLTPAGDDFLVGLLAALHTAAPGEASRGNFHAALATHIAANVVRTTPIAAHYLRLAAAGHFTEPLLSLRDALLGQTDEAQLDAALQRALAVGATSGADTVSGLLAGLTAWISPCAAPTMAL